MMKVISQFDAYHLIPALFFQLLSINLLILKTNIGQTDKVIGIILALVIAAIGIYLKSWWGLVALIPLITDAISFCPLYKIFGVNTCSQKSVQ